MQRRRKHSRVDGNTADDAQSVMFVSITSCSNVHSTLELGNKPQILLHAAPIVRVIFGELSRNHDLLYLSVLANHLLRLRTFLAFRAHIVSTIRNHPRRLLFSILACYFLRIWNHFMSMLFPLSIFAVFSSRVDYRYCAGSECRFNSMHSISSFSFTNKRW